MNPANGQKNQKALHSAAAGRIYGAHGGFRKLKAFQVAELCCDYTCRFCQRYIPPKDRHVDQMVQAARSGYQTIGEGSEDSATSKKLEMNLTNVAKSSIGELERDYQKHLNRQAEDFEKGGGFSERLYKARTGGMGRNRQNG